MWKATEAERERFDRLAEREAGKALEAIYGAALTAFAEAETVLGTVEQARRSATDAIKAAAPSVFRRMLEAIYEATLPAFAAREYDDVLRQGKAADKLYTFKASGADLNDFWLEVALRFAGEEADDLIAGMTAESVRVVRAQIAAGIEAGEGIEVIRRRLTERLPELSTTRARTIARTEVLRISNYATMEGMRKVAEDTGLELVKEWISSRDARVRPDHASSDGQVVPMEGLFSVGGHSAQYPGDPRLPASQSINCRCTHSALVQ